MARKKKGEIEERDITGLKFLAPPENLWLDPGGPRRFQGIQGKKNVRQAT